MRVLHLVHVFPPESRGGTEMYVESVARAQLSRGNEAAIVCGTETNSGIDPVLENVDGLRVVRLPADLGERYVDGSSPAVTRNVLSVVERDSVDVVHLHHWHGLSTDVVSSLADIGVPTVVTLSDLFVSCPLFFRLPDGERLCPPDLHPEVCVDCLVRRHDSQASFIRPALQRRKALLRRELECAAAVIVLSQEQLAFLSADPICRGLSLVVLPYPSTRTRSRVGFPAERGFGGELRLVSWGGLVPGKGLHVLVEACERSRASRHLDVHHYGTILDAEYERRLRAMARTTRLSFHGRFAQAKLETEIASHDVAVFPSLFLETHGTVVDEALQLGLPVIVSDRGAPSARIGQRGLSFRAGDARQLSEVLDELVENPALLRRLREGDIPVLDSMDEHLDALEAMYRLARLKIAQAG